MKLFLRGWVLHELHNASQKVKDALGEIVSFFCGHANANDSLHIRVSERGSLLLRRQLPLLLCRSSLRRALCL